MKKSCILIIYILFYSLSGYSQKTYSEEQIIKISDYIYSLEKKDSIINIYLSQIKDDEIASLADPTEKLVKLIEIFERQNIENAELKVKAKACDSLLAAMEAKYRAMMKDMTTVREVTKPEITTTASASGVKFGVQIGAYRFPKKFNYSKVKPLGEVEKKHVGDGITRFIIGGFNTIDEANEFRKKILEKGITDAFTVGIVNGERKLISELRKLNLIQLP